jgi:hypothetical protein
MTVCNCRSIEGEGDCEACRAAGMALFVAAWRFVRHHWIEAAAAACGLAGSFLLATKGQHAAWGWLAFLASNVGWIAFGWIRRHWFLLLQQVGFTASSLWGIWKWMLS